MFSATRATIVVSQARRFSTSLVSAAAEPQPGVLDGVVGLAERAEHPIGDCAEVRPLILELFGEPFLLIHVTYLQSSVSPR